jgi:serine O-acetyltransferase
MDEIFLNNLLTDHQRCPACPSADEISNFFEDVVGALFSGFSHHRFSTISELENHFLKLRERLSNMIQLQKGDALSMTQAFLDNLPALRHTIELDVAAMFAGDPAAKSKDEVIRAYPGFYAIAAYRIAHHFHELRINDIPRMITEQAHSKTGIDIHPAAKIGQHFCIDHGTGIVIGETAVVGHHVKMYQGVTLGAISVAKEDAEKKRHPTIEDRVVLYAGATILGGETVIGHDSIVGGNVWLTRSVPPRSRIYYQANMSDGTSAESDLVIVKTHTE